MKTLAASVLLLAHSWYDPICCSDRDCRPAQKGEIVFESEGIRHVPSGQTLPYGHKNVRVSRDFENHVCINQISGRLLCVYLAGAT